jgi:hypothetical protein
VTAVGKGTLEDGLVCFMRPLAHRLTLPRWRELLAAEATQPDEWYAHPLGLLADMVPEALLLEAVDIARTMLNGQARTRVLARLVARLPATVLYPVAVELLPTMATITDHWTSRTLNACLLPVLPDELLPQALSIARTSENIWHATAILVTLVSRMLAILNEAHAAVRALPETGAQVQMLLQLAPLFPPEQRDAVYAEAYACTLQIEYAEHRCDCLLALAPYLPAAQQEAVYREVLQLIQTGSDTGLRDERLHRMPDNLIAEALLVACAITERLCGDSDI